MSWTDPCRGGCGGTRADCFCEDFKRWLARVIKEQNNYPVFRGRELDERQLKELWKMDKSPIEALNDLGTAA